LVGTYEATGRCRLTKIAGRVGALWHLSFFPTPFLRGLFSPQPKGHRTPRLARGGSDPRTESTYRRNSQ
jgi:hypothetical protein